MHLFDPATISGVFTQFQAEIHEPQFWVALTKIIWINVLLSGDNALVIALACRGLEPRQRVWGMILGAAVAVLLRIIFTGIVATLLELPYLKLIGGLALLVIAAKLLVPENHDEDGIKAASHLWAAVRIVAVADIVMSLDNVIAIAASADMAAARVDIAHASSIKATLIVFGLATSVPLIVAGSAVLMALLERFRVLVWAGGALLGWVAGDIMATDPILAGFFSQPVLHELHAWAGPLGGLIVVGIGYVMVRRHRHLYLDEIMAGAGLVLWIVVDRISDSLYGGATPDLTAIWTIRGVLVALMAVAYIICRKIWHVEKMEA